MIDFSYGFLNPARLGIKSYNVKNLTSNIANYNIIIECEASEPFLIYNLGFFYLTL